MLINFNIIYKIKKMKFNYKKKILMLIIEKLDKHQKKMKNLLNN